MRSSFCMAIVASLLVIGITAQAKANFFDPGLRSSSPLETVQFRRHGGRGYRGGLGGHQRLGHLGRGGFRGGYGGGYAHRYGGRGYGVGAGIAGVAAGALVGGLIAAQGAPGYAAPPQDPRGYCASRYRSYDPQSGTFLGNDGLRHPCP